MSEILDQFYIVSYDAKWVKNFWTDSSTFVSQFDWRLNAPRLPKGNGIRERKT